MQPSSSHRIIRKRKKQACECWQHGGNGHPLPAHRPGDDARPLGEISGHRAPSHKVVRRRDSTRDVNPEVAKRAFRKHMRLQQERELDDAHRSCADSCRESPTRLSTASKWFRRTGRPDSAAKTATQKILSTRAFSKSSTAAPISMDFTVRLSSHLRVLNNSRSDRNCIQFNLRLILASHSTNPCRLPSCKSHFSLLQYSCGIQRARAEQADEFVRLVKENLYLLRVIHNARNEVGNEGRVSRSSVAWKEQRKT